MSATPQSPGSPVAVERRRMFHALQVARDCGPYDELPLLRPDVDPQVLVSRNDCPQPFWLVCSHDTIVVNLVGEGRLAMADGPARYFALEPGDIVYVPAGIPHRHVPRSESVTLRYKPLDAGWEAVSWYCEGCGEELHRVEFDTASELPQHAYWRACAAFNEDEALRRCRACGVVADQVPLERFRWREIALGLSQEAPV